MKKINVLLIPIFIGLIAATLVTFKPSIQNTDDTQIQQITTLKSINDIVLIEDGIINIDEKQCNCFNVLGRLNDKEYVTIAKIVDCQSTINNDDIIQDGTVHM